jgi:D-proline reductase (dithiol) PrdB
MHPELMAEYIKQEWAPDFHYAVHDKAPWVPFTKEVSSCVVALVTCAGVHRTEDAPFAAVDDCSYRVIPGHIPLTELTVTHAFYDTTETLLDLNTIFPLERLRELAAQGEIGGIAPRHFSFMGFIPHWECLLDPARAIAKALREDGVDLVLLTPGSPLCNHSTALIQRVIEEAGIVTVSITLERDITALVKPSRALLVHFPAGCPMGEPFAVGKQLAILREIFAELKRIQQPGTIVKTPFKWTRTCSTPQCKL